MCNNALEYCKNAHIEMPVLDWDDLRYALAIGSAGSLAAAARTLGVNHTTVLRRLDALEAQLGSRLFDRLRSGYQPTAANRSPADRPVE